MSSSPSSTTIIFVPGGWHNPTCYAKVVAPLEAAGYNTSLVHLATVNPSSPAAQTDWSADVTTIRNAITTAADAGQSVVLVVHSYSGLPGSEAVRDLDWQTRQAKNLPGGVTRLVYVAAFLLPVGQSLLGALGGEDLPWWDIAPDRATVLPLTPETIFDNDLPADGEEVQNAVAALRPHVYATFSSEVNYEAWRDVPTTYVYCLQDNAIQISVQRRLVEEVAKGVDIHTETLDASHSPFYSTPRELVNVIRRAAGEEV